MLGKRHENPVPNAFAPARIRHPEGVGMSTPIANDDRMRALLAAARAGDPVALGHLLEQYRLYLLGISRGEMGEALRAKCGESDVVQEAFAEAAKAIPRFAGTTEGEFRGWLRSILLHKCSELDRHFRGTQKRAADREQPLVAASGMGELLADSGPSPSSFASEREEAERLRRAMTRLPEHYRQLLHWRHWEGIDLLPCSGKSG
jgi:RNA polymerase sigma-70 factor (ECF subfamily)